MSVSVNAHFLLLRIPHPPMMEGIENKRMAITAIVRMNGRIQTNIHSCSMFARSKISGKRNESNTEIKIQPKMWRAPEMMYKIPRIRLCDSMKQDNQKKKIMLCGRRQQNQMQTHGAHLLDDGFAKSPSSLIYLLPGNKYLP